MHPLTGTVLLHIKEVKGDVPNDIMVSLLNGSLMTRHFIELAAKKDNRYTFSVAIGNDIVMQDEGWSVTLTHPVGVSRVVAAITDLATYAMMGFHVDSAETKKELQDKGISVYNGYYQYSAGLVDFGYFLVDLLSSRGIHQAIMQPDREYTPPYLPALRKDDQGVTLCYMTETQNDVFPTLELALLDTAFKSPKKPGHTFNLYNFMTVVVIPQRPNGPRPSKESLGFKNSPALYN